MRLHRVCDANYLLGSGTKWDVLASEVDPEKRKNLSRALWPLLTRPTV